MAGNNHFSSYIYGKETFAGNKINFQKAGGILNSFPSAAFRIYEADAGTTAGAGNVTILSIIESLPSGLNVHAEKYYSADATATLATNAT